MFPILKGRAAGCLFLRETQSGELRYFHEMNKLKVEMFFSNFVLL